MKKPGEKIIPIDRIDESDRCALVPGRTGRRSVRRLKELDRKKGNCYFARGVPAGLADFIYRSVVKLKLADREFVFSRGAVKRNGLHVLNAVGVVELDWDCGISIKIPARLRYGTFIRLSVDGTEHDLRLMELIVLRALMQMAHPGKATSWYADMAALILAKGWPAFGMDKKPVVVAGPLPLPD